MIQMKMATGGSHHREEVEESRPPQAQQDKRHTRRDEVRARVKVKVQLVVPRRRMIMARAGRIG
jgi:hypothetical protein